MKDHFQVYLCAKFQVDILKNDRVLIFWTKTTTFHAVPRESCVLAIFKFCPIWAVQKVFEGHYSRSWPKNWPITFITPPKHELWPSLDLVTSTLNMITESLGWYLELSQTRSMLFIDLFPFDTATKSDTPNRHILTLTWAVTASVTRG